MYLQFLGGQLESLQRDNICRILDAVQISWKKILLKFLKKKKKSNLLNMPILFLWCKLTSRLVYKFLKNLLQRGSIEWKMGKGRNYLEQTFYTSITACAARQSSYFRKEAFY